MYSRDGTVVSGDSTGTIRAWDSKFGTLLQAIPCLKADVLCMAVSKDQSSIFCSGIDFTVVRLDRLQKQAAGATVIVSSELVKRC